MGKIRNVGKITMNTFSHISKIPTVITIQPIESPKQKKKVFPINIINTYNLQKCSHNHCAALTESSFSKNNSVLWSSITKYNQLLWPKSPSFSDKLATKRSWLVQPTLLEGTSVTPAPAMDATDLWPLYKLAQEKWTFSLWGSIIYHIIILWGFSWRAQSYRAMMFCWSSTWVILQIRAGMLHHS